MKPIIIFIAMLLPCFAHSEVTPQKGEYDPRVRVVDYNPLNVVKLSTFYGVSTHIQFAPNESIVDVAVGDDQAWLVKQRGNHLYIKPKALKANTNVTVVTNLRTYQFALVVQPKPVNDPSAWKDANLIYSLSFRYPEDEAVKTQSNMARTWLKEAKTTQSKEASNINYWVAGATDISPTDVRDDGRFMYLTFGNNRDMPAVYAVDADGNEAIVNSHIDDNMIVIQKMVRRLVLRKGNAVACLINKSYNADGGIDNRTGTISPQVERVIKGAGQ